MPRFELMPLNEAVRSFALTGKRGAVMAEYLGYIDRLEEGQAGKLQVAPDETVGAVRRRLGAAAKLAGKELTIKRVGDEILFWSQMQGQGRGGRRRGRPRKTPLS